MLGSKRKVRWSERKQAMQALRKALFAKDEAIEYGDSLTRYDQDCSNYASKR